MSFENCAVPVYIVCRDRLRDLEALVEWLERAGHERLIFLDNASTYEPLIDYLRRSPHEVVRLTHNWGSRVLWIADTLKATGRPTEWFIYTDPDVLPIGDCPHDLAAHLHELLLRYPSIPKAGPGLFLDDVPSELSSLDWERELVSPARQLEPHVFDSLIDTTFALYRPGAEFEMRAIRTTGSHQARHMPWYRQDASQLAEDDRWYLEHADSNLGAEGTTWRPT